MTADGHHILGPAPAAEGFHFASGCNIAGLSISPTVGDALAAWIAGGRPSVDLSGDSKTHRGLRINCGAIPLGRALAGPRLAKICGCAMAEQNIYAAHHRQMRGSIGVAWQEDLDLRRYPLDGSSVTFRA
jgi:hypothetical protein